MSTPIDVDDIASECGVQYVAVDKSVLDKLVEMAAMNDVQVAEHFGYPAAFGFAAKDGAMSALALHLGKLARPVSLRAVFA